MQISATAPAYIPGSIVSFDTSLIRHHEAIVAPNDEEDALEILSSQSLGIVMVAGCCRYPFVVFILERAGFSAALLYCMGTLLALAFYRRSLDSCKRQGGN